MKKSIIGLTVALLVSFVGYVNAGMVVAELTVTNNQPITYTDPIIVDGVLESIIVEQTNPGTATVTVANYVGTTAVDTYASLTDLSTAYKLVRPVFLPTDNTGTALAAAGGGALTTNYSQILSVQYKEALIAGGNIKLAVTPKAGLTAASHTVKVTLFYRKDR